MATLYGLTTCDACRRARRWLRDHGIEHAFVDVREQPPGAADIARWIGRFGWRALLNRRSATWRTLPESERNGLDETRATALLRQYPLLLKRPILEAGSNAELGFDGQRYSRVFER